MDRGWTANFTILKQSEMTLQFLHEGRLERQYRRNFLPDDKGFPRSKAGSGVYERSQYCPGGDIVFTLKRLRSAD